MMNPEFEKNKGEVLTEGEYTTLIFKRLLRHPPETVWNAITDPEELKGWLMCSSAKVDYRKGGRVEMVAGPSQIHSTGTILEWNPPRAFEYEWNVEPGGPMPDGQKAIFRYDLVPKDSGTFLTVTYRRLTPNTAMGFAPGSHVLQDRLEAQLDGTPLPGWMERFQEVAPLYGFTLGS
jgi:uncharacterized protein YndB with AHSA1/START domain